MQPAASAGAILRVAIAAGKFHGVTSSATPIGWYWTRMRLAPAGRDGELAVQPDRFLGEPAEELGRVGDLAGGVGQRLAVLERDQLGQHVAALDHQLVAAAQDLGALARGGRGPGRRRRVGGVHGGEGVLDRAVGDGGDGAAGRGIDDVDARPAPGRRAPPMRRSPGSVAGSNERARVGRLVTVIARLHQEVAGRTLAPAAADRHPPSTGTRAGALGFARRGRRPG